MQGSGPSESSVWSRQVGSESDDPARTPLVLLAGELEMGGVPARRVLEELGCSVCVEQRETVLRQDPSKISPMPQLLISRLRAGGVELADFARRARQVLGASRLPILGVAERREVIEDLGTIRSAGVSGLVSASVSIDQFSNRVRLILDPFDSRASEMRAPCFIPGELYAHDRATPTVVISLSPGGVRAAVGESYAPNDAITVRLRLPGSEADLDISGRVTFVAASRDDFHLQEIGIVFIGCPSSVRAQLAKAVTEILRSAEGLTALR